MRTIILGCKSDHVSVRVRTIAGKKESIRNHKVRDLPELVKLFKTLKFNEASDVLMGSSSMNFPKEYTSSKKILKLVRQINGK